MADGKDARPVVHVVLFKIRESATQAQKDTMARAISALVDEVPGVLELRFGEDFSKTRAGGFTHVLVVRLANKAALEAYGPHPAHQRVVTEFIAPIREAVLAVDFFEDEPAPEVVSRLALLRHPNRAVRLGVKLSVVLGLIGAGFLLGRISK
jgi:hypothetical protein